MVILSYGFIDNTTCLLFSFHFFIVLDFLYRFIKYVRIKVNDQYWHRSNFILDCGKYTYLQVEFNIKHRTISFIELISISKRSQVPIDSMNNSLHNKNQYLAKNNKFIKIPVEIEHCTVNEP